MEFTCTAGDVTCLIGALTQANSNGVATTLTLEAGTYTFTEVNDTTGGPNGLPSVTGVVILQGAGANTTILEREASTPDFRLVQVAATGALTLEGLTMRGDRFSPGEGAGLFNGGTLSLSRTTVADNFGGLGGGRVNRGGTVTMAGTTFVHNLAGCDGGGAVNDRGTLIITDTTFASNTSEGAGALHNRSGTVILTNTALVDNQGDSSGGILNGSGAVVLTTSTIARNFSPALSGGGLANGAGGTAILTNTTVADNTAFSRRGGLDNAGGQLVVLNTIVARNTGGPGAKPVECTGQVTSLGTNLIGDPTGCTITLLPTDLTGDPGLGDFTDNGTPGNGHVPLLPSSPAIDAGNDAFCPPTDQLGQPWVGRCDIGAIEFQGGDPAAASRSPRGHR